MATIYTDSTNGNDVTGNGTIGNKYQTFGRAYSDTDVGDTHSGCCVFHWISSDPDHEALHAL
jgi:hypothetical protein